MTDNLVIVESPAKAKTIKKYLGKDFEVLASYGHVRDLIEKEGAIDTEHGFKMTYAVIEKNAPRVDAIEKALRRAKALFLATDPDREGEAISWHLAEILRERGALGSKDVHRVRFYEITRNAIREAVDHPDRLNENLINAQQARRALDYLVGFTLSPLLWKKIKPGLSAGRVQSVALRLICEREDEIGRFVRQEYWTIEADAGKADSRFVARLVEYRGEKVEADTRENRFSFRSETEAREVESTLLAAARGELMVTSVEKKPRRRNPAPPFTTSTLQQEAARKLGFTARRTMQNAQRLYEAGFITYMRTDSVSLSNEAVQEIRGTIVAQYGQRALAEQVNVYRTKSKNAQEAHEAIRPTSAARNLEAAGREIEDADQRRLYGLIWQRTMACQMAPAVYDTVTVDLMPAAVVGADGTAPARDRHRLRASGSTLLEPGFLAVYHEDRDEDDANDDDQELRLPPLAVGERVRLAAIRPEQHFTEPPPRYTEASLVKALEAFGIGRPSTYAAIIETLRYRQYVEMNGRAFVPTDIGRIVSRFLVRYFTVYVDFNFTAQMEDVLDEISNGEKAWQPELERFWKPFRSRVAEIEKSVSREEVSEARELGRDPATDRPISVRMGQYGPYVQLGTKDDPEKPKFAGLRPGQKMDEVDLADALKLLSLPRTLGSSASGEAIAVGVGRFGPYVKYGAKYASIKDDDPYTLELPRALEIVAEKERTEAERRILDFGDEGVRVLKGRYGPYITDGSRNARIPKDREPASLSLEECRALLAAAPERKGRFGRRARTGGKAAAAPRTRSATPAGESAPAAESRPARARGPIAPVRKKKPSAPESKPARKRASGKAAAAKKKVAATRRSARKD
jgi:DNA topoisomerase-1